jgi:hypothetical protein
VNVEGSHPRESFAVQLPSSIKTKAEEHDGHTTGHGNDFCAFHYGLKRSLLNHALFLGSN